MAALVRVDKDRDDGDQVGAEAKVSGPQEYGFDYGYPSRSAPSRPSSVTGTRWLSGSAPAGRSKHRRRRYFWRRVAVLLGIGLLGAVAWSAGQQLVAGASSRSGAPVRCPHGQVVVPAVAGAAGGAGECGIAYVARNGDTIWSVAVRFAGNGDPRPLEYRLEAQIGDGVLQPGQLLVVPR